MADSRDRTRPRQPMRMYSYSGIDNDCADLLDALDQDILVPLDLRSDVPFRPRLTEIKVPNFLRAVLKCAPAAGRSWVEAQVRNTKGDARKLQALAGVWFNRIVFLARALYQPARPSDDIDTVLDPSGEVRQAEFRERLRERDGYRTTIGRRPDSSHSSENASARKSGNSTRPIHIIPPIHSLRPAPEEPFSWDLLRRLSGVDPREITGESANRLPNGLYGDEDDQSSFNMFAWYLEPELDVNHASIPHHYIFRCLLSISTAVQKDRAPVAFKDFASPNQSEDLPDPRYLALHAAIGGILIKSGGVFYVTRLFHEMKNTRTLEADGSSNVIHLFASHSISKLFTV